MSNLTEDELTFMTLLKEAFDLNEVLTCPICLQLFEDPVAVECNHRFCQKCVNNIFSSRRSICPLCKAHIKKGLSHSSTELLPALKFLKIVLQQLKPLLGENVFSNPLFISKINKVELPDLTPFDELLQPSQQPIPVRRSVTTYQHAKKPEAESESETSHKNADSCDKVLEWLKETENCDPVEQFPSCDSGKMQETQDDSLNLGSISQEEVRVSDKSNVVELPQKALLNMSADILDNVEDINSPINSSTIEQVENQILDEIAMRFEESVESGSTVKLNDDIVNVTESPTIADKNDKANDSDIFLKSTQNYLSSKTIITRCIQYLLSIKSELRDKSYDLLFTNFINQLKTGHVGYNDIDVQTDSFQGIIITQTPFQTLTVESQTDEIVQSDASVQTMKDEIIQKQDVSVNATVTMLDSYTSCDLKKTVDVATNTDHITIVTTGVSPVESEPQPLTEGMTVTQIVTMIRQNRSIESNNKITHESESDDTNDILAEKNERQNKFESDKILSENLCKAFEAPFDSQNDNTVVEMDCEENMELDERISKEFEASFDVSPKMIKNIAPPMETQESDLVVSLQPRTVTVAKRDFQFKNVTNAPLSRPENVSVTIADSSAESSVYSNTLETKLNLLKRAAIETAGVAKKRKRPMRLSDSEEEEDMPTRINKKPKSQESKTIRDCLSGSIEKLLSIDNVVDRVFQKYDNGLIGQGTFQISLQPQLSSTDSQVLPSQSETDKITEKILEQHAKHPFSEKHDENVNIMSDDEVIDSTPETTPRKPRRVEDKEKENKENCLDTILAPPPEFGEPIVTQPELNTDTILSLSPIQVLLPKPTFNISATKLPRSCSTPQTSSKFKFRSSKQTTLETYITPESSPPRPVCVMGSRLDNEQLVNINMLMKQMSGKFSRTFNTDVTHLVVNVDEHGCVVDHTVKYVSAIASRIWVVSYRWVLDSIKAGRFMKEDFYEVLDVTGIAGPKQSRLFGDKNLLLKGWRIYAAPPFKSTSVNEVQFIITKLGGKLVSAPDELLDKRPGEYNLIITESSETQNVNIYDVWLESLKVLTVEIEWLCRSVGQYKLTNLRRFTLCSDENVQDLNYPPQLLDEFMTYTERI